MLLGLTTGLLGCCHSIVAAPYYRWRIKANLRSASAFEGGHFAVPGGIPTLHIYGTPTEMGRQYGGALKPALRNLHHYLRCVLPRDMRERLTAAAMQEEPYLPEEIREELHQISTASNMPYEELVALNTLVRIHCSALATYGPATHDGRMIMGRNAEYFGFGLGDRGSLLVVYHPTDGIPIAAASFLGMAGAYTGVNARGVAFGNMLVFNASDDRTNPKGLPIQIAMRLAAQRANSASEMASRLIRMPRKIPINVMIADAHEALALELGLRRSSQRKGKDGTLAMSNFFRDPALAAGGAAPYCERYESLLASAADREGRFSVEDMETALHRARLRYGPKRKDLNLQCVVFEPEAMRMHLSLNRVPASAGPFSTVDLNALFDAPREASGE